MINFLFKPISIAPLVVFRICFGLLMLFSTLRFWLNGWIEDFYISPEFHFTYYGFDWVKPLGEVGMYTLFFVVGLSSICIAFGLLYRVMAVIFFLSFTYIELIDKTTYLNHYYFVSLIGLLLIFLPAHRHFSLDAFFKPSIKRTKVAAINIYTLIFQISIVYIMAGLAKINADWLLRAEPIATWLKPRYDVAVIGGLFKYPVIHYAFSWFGMFYDCLIPFFLLWSQTRYPAFFVLVVFHVMTAVLFPIGIFPFVMILSALIFFPASFHERILQFIKRPFYASKQETEDFKLTSSVKSLAIFAFGFYFLVQVMLPFRYLLYPGDLFWNEEGFRFSWRVMLVEKNGLAFFYVKHPDYPGMRPVENSLYLTPRQEKQMAFQPDMLIQYAHYLKEEFEGKVFIENGDTLVLNDPEIRADVFVNVNGRASQQLVTTNVVLSDQPYNLEHRKWILPYRR